MSWSTLSQSFPADADSVYLWTSLRRPQTPQMPTRPAQTVQTLGTATAASRWGWASPQAEVVAPARVQDDEEPVATALVVTRALRAEMAEMAQMMGKSEDDVWAEAAREWLLRRMRNDEPPPTTPAAAPVANPRTRRMWSEIDEMLAALRNPRYVAAPSFPRPEPAVPAA
jgi:hypothetical protein